MELHLAARASGNVLRTLSHYPQTKRGEYVKIRWPLLRDFQKFSVISITGTESTWEETGKITIAKLLKRSFGNTE